jgi:transcriptional regulator with XRE-family HTH domain
MKKKTSTHVERDSGSVVSGQSRKRATANIELATDPKSAAGDALDLFGTELRHDEAPLGDRRRADVERPRDIRGALKVIKNFAFEHASDSTTVHFPMQAGFKRAVLTLVHMAPPLETLADRLADAMKERGINASGLAKECGVTPTAAGKWLKDGGKMNADNLAAAARALGVRDDWLRTGKLPREREHRDDERRYDQVIDLLQQLAGPIAALHAVIEEATRTPKKRAGKP